VFIAVPPAALAFETLASLSFKIHFQPCGNYQFTYRLSFKY